jgi:hypothetical protein
MLDMKQLFGQLTCNLFLSGKAISPSLGSMIDCVAGDYFEEWGENVSVKFHNIDRTVNSINESWSVLFSFCDEEELKKFFLRFDEDLLFISELEAFLVDHSARSHQRSEIYKLIDPIIGELSEEFMNCIDSSRLHV